ncbi:hypothetical protein QJS10_CPA01g02111 [Acorus calamus]|uniref:PGG domain-containing protein n=1 Tax=Acorus calamus TaxID=4465 RepID=A0AAV9FML4_ACOCL|nr:hypothetical protein QJS10_CPA01g02111 [Acorus calamus]
METTERVHRRRSEVFFKEVRGALLMVAALIATVTFTAGIYPPGGFWQDDDSQGKHTAGKPIMVDKNKAKYEKFMSRNTHAFIQSLLLTMLLMVSYGTTNHALLVALVLAEVKDKGCSREEEHHC